MPTTAATAVNAKKRQPISKWSGSDEPQSYYNHEDTDTMWHTADELRYIKWYQSRDHSKWRNADEENDMRVTAPAKAIVREIRRVAPAAPAPVSTSRISSVFWSTPLSIASGEEPVFEPEYPEPEYPDHEESSSNFKFGVCCECDVGLYDKSEFVCRRGANGNVNTCNACHNYQINLHVGGEHGGCN
jgi:hypothetical protein